MKNILALFRILSKNSEMKVPKKGTKGSMYLALGIIALSCIMIPCCLVVGFVSYIMTEALSVDIPSTAGLLAEIHIMSAFSMIFGILVIFNIMFFSSDREHLVPLPFKSYEIMTGKFLYSYMAESVMEFMVLISMFVGFFFAIRPGFVSVISSLVGVALIPLLPMMYCVILSLLIFSLIKGLKITKLINHASSILMICFVALFLLSFKDAGSITVENYINTLQNDSNLFTNVLNKIFFTVPFLLDAIKNENIISLIIYILCNIAVLVVMILLGSFLYQPCLYAVGAMGDRQKKKKTALTATKEKSIFSAYLFKEYKVLLRTRAYSGNCVYINLLWPAGLCLYLYLNRAKENFLTLKGYITDGNEKALVVLGIITVLGSFIACAMNSLASTAFTREGAHLSLIKYIPVPYKTQMLVKGFVSLSLTYPPLLLCDIIATVFFKLSVLRFLFYAVVIFLCVLITTIIGLVLDSAHPHSTWDDEYSALRGNLNTFFDMAVVMVMSLIISAVSFVIFSFTSIGVIGFDLLILGISTVITVIGIVYGKKIILKNMEDM